ncbi:unnamed protein product [Effrenium voratum]|uniref:Uncharacterized protein n=1 Tax=Effrenium voratum TaxID=2562239 RepID=A0AA36J4J1_9DINO|nr:unnamed protein product [Effrenium voratum]
MVRQQTTAAKWVWKVKAKRRLVWKVKEQPRSSAPVLLGRLEDAAAKAEVKAKAEETRVAQKDVHAPVDIGDKADEDAAAKAEVKAKAEETRVAQKDVHAPVDIGDKADEVAASMEVIRSQLAHCEQGGAILAYMRAACWRCAAQDTQEEHGGDNSTEEEDKSDIDVLDEGDEDPTTAEDTKEEDGGDNSAEEEDKSDAPASEILFLPEGSLHLSVKVDVLDEGDEVLKSQLAQDELGSAILAGSLVRKCLGWVGHEAKRRLVWKVKEQPRSSAPVLLGRLEDAAAKAEVKATAETGVAQKDAHAPVDIGDKADEAAASMEVIRSQLAHCEQGGAILAYMRAACWRCAAKDPTIVEDTQEEHGGDNSTEEEDKSDVDVLDEGDEEDESDVPASEIVFLPKGSLHLSVKVDVLDEGDEARLAQASHAAKSRSRSAVPCLLILACLLWNVGELTFASPAAHWTSAEPTALTKSSARTLALGQLPRDNSPVTTSAAAASATFFTKVFAAGAQGATAAFVAAILSAMAEPLVNRLLVKRMTVGQAMKEMNFKLIANFFLTTFPTNMLKFPVFEIINMAMTFTAFSPGLSGTISGFLFCTVMLPVTNYRFRKSMGWEIKPALLYQAYVPTVARDIIYGFARGWVAVVVAGFCAPTSFVGQSAVFAFTIWAACILSSPCNEWRGFTLQPKDKKLSFGEYFKPVNYARSTGIGATIMGIALFVGRLVTPYAETAFAYFKVHPLVGVGILAVLAGGLKVITSGEDEKEEKKEEKKEKTEEKTEEKDAGDA